MSYDLPLILSVFFLGSACGGLLVSLRVTRRVDRFAKGAEGSEGATASNDFSTPRGLELVERKRTVAAGVMKARTLRQ